MKKEQIKKCLLENIDVLASLLEQVLKPACKFKVGDKVAIIIGGGDEPWEVESLEEAPQRIRLKQEADMGGNHYCWPREDELKLYKEKKFRPGDWVRLKESTMPAMKVTEEDADGLVWCHYTDIGQVHEKQFLNTSLKLVRRPQFHSGDVICLKDKPYLSFTVFDELEGYVRYKDELDGNTVLRCAPIDSVLYYGQENYKPGEILYRICDLSRTIPLTVVSQNSNEVVCNYTVFGKNHTKRFYTCNLMR